MSLHQLTLVWKFSKQEGNRLLLMLAIADYASDDGEAFPSIQTLADKSRMSVRNARYVVKQLVDSGELEVQPGAGRNGSNLYRLKVTPNLELFTAPASLAGGVQSLQLQNRVGGDAIAIAGGAAIAIAPEPSGTVKEPSKRVRRAPRVPLPPNFGISERVKAWADEHGFTDYLPSHLEHFLGKAKANGWIYADWDAAFMNCIRDDWGEVRTKAKAKAPAGKPVCCEFRGIPYIAGREACGLPNARPAEEYGGLPVCAHHLIKVREDRTAVNRGSVVARQAIGDAMGKLKSRSQQQEVSNETTST